MSHTAIQRALIGHLKTLTPTWRTIIGNAPQSAKDVDEYQLVVFEGAGPKRTTKGGGANDTEFWHGFMRVNLVSKRNNGLKEVSERADLMRAHFPRALVLTESPVSLSILNTEIADSGANERQGPRWYHQAVNVHWQWLN